MTYDGIPIAALDFYEDLEDDNSKAFWDAHKSVYDSSVKAPLTALAELLAPEFGTPKLFRPYRDVRFAKDKTPYKTQQGVWFADTSVYFHVSAAGLFAGGGYWRTTPDQVSRYRRAVADDVAGPLLSRAVADVRGAGLELGGHVLARVPAGHDKDHPRADLLKHRTLMAHRDLGAPDWLSTPKSYDHLADVLRATGPLIAWLDTHVGPD